MVTLNCCLHQATIFHPSHFWQSKNTQLTIYTEQSVAIILSSNFIWKLRINIRIHTEWKMSLLLWHAIGYVQTEVKSRRALYFTGQTHVSEMMDEILADKQATQLKLRFLWQWNAEWNITEWDHQAIYITCPVLLCEIWVCCTEFTYCYYLSYYIWYNFNLKMNLGSFFP